jgi:DNA modification methylase
VSVVILRGDAAHLPLPDASVDLIVTSPPYFGQRSYTDNGEHYAGQIGSEATPREYIANLLACTREWMRVLKPGGSIFVNLGDKYASGDGSGNQAGLAEGGAHFNGGHRAIRAAGHPRRRLQFDTARPKSLLGLPWRYAIGCTDDLGLILRSEIIWQKPNGMPESVVDRVRRSHEQVFHLTKQPRYFAAVDEIREQHLRPKTAAQMARDAGSPRSSAYHSGNAGIARGGAREDDPRTFTGSNPLGKIPGSVWEIPSQPLTVPAYLNVDHFAAWPMELPRRIILGWSPSGVCTECGEGRRPVGSSVRTFDGIPRHDLPAWADPSAPRRAPNGAGHWRFGTDRTITGYACACTPYTDHPERRGKDFHAGTDPTRGMNDGNGGERYRRYVEDLANPRGPVREYHFDRRAPAPTRPAVVLDPFGGTGTTALVADMLGRTGITVDRSMDYCRIARWRTSDPAERARALGVPKPPPVIDGQGDLFNVEAS